VPVSRAAFGRVLLEQLDSLYAEYLRHGSAPVLAAWEARCDLIGKQVEVDGQGAPLHGMVAGIDRDGALLLTLADGTTERVLAGDVKVRSEE